MRINIRRFTKYVLSTLCVSMFIVVGFFHVPQLKTVLSLSKCSLQNKVIPSFQTVLTNYSKYIIHAPVIQPETWCIIIVLLPVQDLYIRGKIKSLWANKQVSNYVKNKEVQIVYLYGIREHANRNRKNIEFIPSSDVLKVNVPELYSNLILKELIAFKWASEKIQNGYIFKIDGTDTVINIDRAINELKYSQSNNKKEIDCFTWAGVTPIRDQCDPWYVPFTAVSTEVFPTYCSGPAYSMSMTALREILKYVPYTQPIMVEDVFITGILARKASIYPRHRSEIFSRGCQMTAFDKVRLWISRKEFSMKHDIFCDKKGGKLTAVLNAHNCKEKSLDYLHKELLHAPCEFTTDVI